MARRWDSIPEKFRESLNEGHALTKDGIVFSIERVRREANECEAAMLALDDLGAPREHDGEPLSLPERIVSLVRRQPLRTPPVVTIMERSSWEARYGTAYPNERAADLDHAIKRYRLAGFTPPEAWVAELRELSMAGYGGWL